MPRKRWPSEFAAVVAGHAGKVQARTELVFCAAVGERNTHRQEVLAWLAGALEARQDAGITAPAAASMLRAGS
eukprot:7868205-Alexandrium_andersonii.AAC.1